MEDFPNIEDDFDAFILTLTCGSLPLGKDFLSVFFVSLDHRQPLLIQARAHIMPVVAYPDMLG